MDESLSKQSVGLKGYGRSGRLTNKNSYIEIHNMPDIEKEYSIQFSIFVHQVFKEDLNSFEDKKIRVFQKFHSNDKKNLKVTFGQDSRKLFVSIPHSSNALFSVYPLNISHLPLII